MYTYNIDQFIGIFHSGKLKRRDARTYTYRRNDLTSSFTSFEILGNYS